MPDPPQHPARVDQREIAKHPQPILRRPDLHPERLRDLLLVQMPPPIVRVLHQQMHLEIPRVLGDVEVLQQETAVAMVDVGEGVVGPGDGEA